MNWEEVLKAGMPKRQQRVIEQIMSDGKRRTPDKFMMLLSIL